MYKIDADGLSLLSAKMAKIRAEITKRRAFLDPCMRAIESYVAHERLLYNSVDLLLGLPLTAANYSVQIFTEDPARHAKGLIDAIKLAGNYKLCVYQQTLQNYEYIIRVNTWAVATLFNNLYEGPTARSRRDTPLWKLMSTQERPGIFDQRNHILCFSPEIQLIELYRQLYSPQCIGQWQEIAEKIAQLWPLVKYSRIEFGGSEQHHDRAHKINAEILAKYARSETVLALVNDSAALSLNSAGESKMQLISSDTQEQITLAVQSAASRLFPGIKIIAIEQTPKIPIDFRIRKYSYYYQDGESRVLFLEVFNSLAYDTLPWSNEIEGVRYAHPYVQLRYQLINLWIINLTRLDAAAKENMWSKRLQWIEQYRKHVATPPDPAKYVGRIIDEGIAKKQLKTIAFAKDDNADAAIEIINHPVEPKIKGGAESPEVDEQAIREFSSVFAPIKNEIIYIICVNVVFTVADKNIRTISFQPLSNNPAAYKDLAREKDRILNFDYENNKIIAAPFTTDDAILLRQHIVGKPVGFICNPAAVDAELRELVATLPDDREEHNMTCMQYAFITAPFANDLERLHYLVQQYNWYRLLHPNSALLWCGPLLFSVADKMHFIENYKRQEYLADWNLSKKFNAAFIDEYKDGQLYYLEGRRIGESILFVKPPPHLVKYQDVSLVKKATTLKTAPVLSKDKTEPAAAKNNKMKKRGGKYDKYQNNEQQSRKIVDSSIFGTAEYQELLAARLADQKAVGKLPAQITLDDIPCELKYTSAGKMPQPAFHIGQRKLFMSELQFLNSLPVEITAEPFYVVYAGAAPSNKILYLSNMYPQCKFILVDPNEFNIYIERVGQSHWKTQNITSSIVYLAAKYHDYPHIWDAVESRMNAARSENSRTAAILAHQIDVIEFIVDSPARIFLWEDYYTCEISEMLRGLPGPTYFWSDIRTNAQDAPTDLDILWNLAQQYNWIKILEPIAAMVKFRCPFYDSEGHLEANYNKEPYAADLERAREDYGIDFITDYRARKLRYFSGRVYLQTWEGANSTETRLWIADCVAKPVEYDYFAYENKFFAYNNCDRIFLLHENPLVDDQPALARELGLDYCNDCAIEARIWQDYADKYDEHLDIYQRVADLSELTGRPLGNGCHGTLLRPFTREWYYGIAGKCAHKK